MGKAGLGGNARETWFGKPGCVVGVAVLLLMALLPPSKLTSSLRLPATFVPYFGAEAGEAADEELVTGLPCAMGTGMGIGIDDVAGGKLLCVEGFEEFSPMAAINSSKFLSLSIVGVI